MSLDEVVKALEKLPNLSNDSFSENDSDSSETYFFCVEDTFLASDVQVSVEGVGKLDFPIQEQVVRNIVEVSEKAMFGRGDKTILDTSVRDTHMIPAKKLSVHIAVESFADVLNRVSQEMNLEATCTLVPHLYNMLIYGPGQFFKMHQDTEKVSNMIATLIIILPSAHKGGDLIVRHNSVRHRFFGSSNPIIIKCIAFYSDCFHEVLKVDEGYRIALTYNIELKSKPISAAVPLNNNLRDAVVNYFGSRKRMIFLLDHQYSERNLRWYLMKGVDRTRAHGLFVVAKQKGYSPCLALAEYYKSEEADYGDIHESNTKLYFWIDENESSFQFEIHDADDEICSISKTEDLFEPFKKEEGGANMGNWAAPSEYWYKRACVVLWVNPWDYQHGYQIQLTRIHQLTMSPGMQGNVKEQINNNLNQFFLIKYWKSLQVKKMILDIAMYLNSGELTVTMLSKLSPEYVLDFGNNEALLWIATTLVAENWRKIIPSWKTSTNADTLLNNVLAFLLQYISDDKADVGISRYLFDEMVDLFTQPFATITETSETYIKFLLRVVGICKKLGSSEDELKLMDKICLTSLRLAIKTVEDFNNLKMAISPELFECVAQSSLLDKITNSTLQNHQRPMFIYSEPNRRNVMEIASLLQICSDLNKPALEQKILGHLQSLSSTYTAAFLSRLFEKLLSQTSPIHLKKYINLQVHSLQLIDDYLRKHGNSNDWSLSIRVPCECLFCHQVNNFFASRMRINLVIPAAKPNRAHIYSHLNPLASLPIKFETVRLGRPQKLTITKLPALISEKQNCTKKLILLKKNIVEVFAVKAEAVVRMADGTFPAKVLKLS